MDVFHPKPRKVIQAVMEIDYDDKTLPDIEKIAQLEILLWLEFAEQVSHPIEVACIQAGRDAFLENSGTVSKNAKTVLSVIPCAKKAGVYAEERATDKLITASIFVAACKDVENEQFINELCSG